MIIRIDHCLFDSLIADLKYGICDEEELRCMIFELRRVSSELTTAIETEKQRDNNRYIGKMVARAAEIFMDDASTNLAEARRNR